ncbi:hypothetical protein Ciccas_006226 [Cichlidogyrus casuarinus]|uniref:Uncharacterized protein n=1 Tax=Cichlidogyrus casuarinus TaxID=1844966 RepID=A0ABD2QA58_9PLAT
MYDLINESSPVARPHAQGAIKLRNRSGRQKFAFEHDEPKVPQLMIPLRPVPEYLSSKKTRNYHSIYVLFQLQWHCSQTSQKLPFKNYKLLSHSLSLAFKRAIAISAVENFGELSGALIQAECFNVIECKYSNASKTWYIVTQSPRYSLEKIISAALLVTNGPGSSFLSDSVNVECSKYVLSLDCTAYSPNLLNLLNFVI